MSADRLVNRGHVTVESRNTGSCSVCGAEMLPAMARCRECGAARNGASRPGNGASTNENPTDNALVSSSIDLDSMFQAAGIENAESQPSITGREPEHRSPAATAGLRQNTGEEWSARAGAPPPDDVPASDKERSGRSSEKQVICAGCGRSTEVPPSLIGKRVKCPDCGDLLPVPGGTPREPQPVREQPQRIWTADQVRPQLLAAVEAALRATPPPPRDIPSEQTVSRADLRRLKRSLAKTGSGTLSMSQLEAAKSAIEEIGRVPDPRVGALLRDHLRDLPGSLFLAVLGVLADRQDAAAFEHAVRALADADEQTLPALVQVCGRLNDLRVLQPLLIIAARFPRCRSHAIEALNHLGAAALSPLVRAATDGEADDEVRCTALEVLEHVPDRRTIPRLAKLLQDSNPAVRLRAVKALSVIENDATLRPLVSALSDSDAQIRASAASALVCRPHRKLTPFLAKALSDPDRNVRLHAVKGLGLCEDESVVAQLRPLLCCGDEEFELACAESMARLGDRKIVPDLLDRLHRELQAPGSEPGAVRIIDALRRLRDDRAVLPLVEMLRHPQDTIRARAAEALGQIGDAAAVDSLIDLLQREFTAKVQAAAAKALGELKAPQAVPALEHALQHSSHVRCQALIALGEIGGTHALRSLIELTEDPAPTVRYHVANSLARMQDRSAVSALEPLTLDSDEMVRRSAFKALKELGDDRNEQEVARSAQLRSGADEQPEKERFRPRFSVTQLVPNFLLGLGSRQTGIYAGGLVVAGGLIALVVVLARNWQSDTVVIRGYVSDISVSGNGEAAAVTRTQGLFEVWDADRRRSTHQSPGLRFTDVFFSPNGSSLLGVAGSSLTLMQFDEDLQVTSQVPFDAPGNSITTVGTSPTGSRVATHSDTGEIVCWNIQSGEGEWTLQVPQKRLQRLAVTEAAERAAAVADGGELLLWNVSTGELAGEYLFPGKPPILRALSFDTTGELLAASTATGDLYFWDVEDLRRPDVKSSQGRPTEILRFVDENQLIVLQGNMVQTWSRDGEQPQSFSIDSELEGSLAAAASSDGSRVVVGADESSELFVYNTASGSLEFKLHEE